MCNVIKFLFKCQHMLRLRRSRCKGTKHKVARTSIRAACTAESFLTVHLQTDCSSCEHQSWESNWLSKLERAATFLARLSENGFAGTREITTLVQELNETYQKASWDARHMASHAFKKSVTRVNITHHKTSRSPLSQEVQPEDVVELQREKRWDEMQEEDYDGDYVASTDPIHPVTTDYAHPWDNDDGNWVSHYLTPEEMEVSADQPAIDLDAGAWSWDINGTEGNSTPANAASQQFYSGQDPLRWKTTDADESLIAWGPEAEATTSTANITLTNGLTTEEKPQEHRIEQVIAAFWSTQIPETLTPPLFSHIQIVSSPSPPQQHQQTDGPNDPFQPRPPTPPSPNSTRANYDKQRKYIKRRLQHDAGEVKYYADWLLVSRWEARAFEGAEGRLVDEPLVRSGRVRG